MSHYYKPYLIRTMVRP